MLRSVGLSGLGTAARLASSLVAISIAARALQPHDFGQLMFLLSLAAILGVPANFGLSTWVLRALPQARAVTGTSSDGLSPARCVAEAWSARWLGSVVMLLVAVPALALLSDPVRLAFTLLMLAMLAEGLAEFAMAVLRACGRHDEDARLGVRSAWIYSLSVGLAAWLTGSILGVALAYLLSRALVAVLGARMASRAVPGGLCWLGWRVAAHRTRASLSYATDYAMTALFGQIDALVLNHHLGPVAVGLHQAGMRMFMAVAQVMPVLANVFLPRLAASMTTASDSRLRQQVVRMQMTFVLVGGLIGAGFSLADEIVVRLLFGEAYLDLLHLLPWFGLLFQVRCAAAAWGITLTAMGAQAFRARASVLHWLLILGLSIWLLPVLHGQGWLLALVAGNFVLWMAYAVRVQLTARLRSRAGLALVLTALALMLLHLGLLLQVQGWVGA